MSLAVVVAQAGEIAFRVSFFLVVAYLIVAVWAGGACPHGLRIIMQRWGVIEFKGLGPESNNKIWRGLLRRYTVTH